MRGAYRRRSAKFHRFILSVMLLAGCCLAGNADGLKDSKNILVIHSYHEGLSWTDGENQGIQEVLGHRQNIELSIEYLDSKRFSLDSISGSFRDFIIAKYAATSFDAIIVSDDNALTFMAGQSKTVFAGIPVVFCGINNLKPEILSNFNGRVTGVVQTLDPDGTIDLIRKLQPDLRNLVVVSDTTPTARAICDQVKKVLARRSDALQTVWLAGLDTATLKERLAGLKRQDAVLLCNFNRDAKGKYYSHEESARMISDVSNAPVYAMEDIYLGTGVAGGYMNTSLDQGREAARLCLKIIETGRIPPVNMDYPNRIMFDHFALMRFGLNHDLLPWSAVIINHPQSLYEQYKSLIWNVSVIFTILMLAFLGASYGLVQSRRTQIKLRASEENLRTTLDSIGDAVITTDTRGNIVRMNPVAQCLTGWEISESIGKPLTEIFKIANALTGEPTEDPVKKVLQRGEVVGLSNHTELFRKDGGRYQIADSAAPIKDDDENLTGVVLVFRDVTADYQMRKTLQESEQRLAEINGCLVELGPAYEANVNALTALCGRLLGANCALYNRLQGGLLCSIGKWQAPTGFDREYVPEGNLCYELIKRGNAEPFVVRHLPETEYARSDSTVSKCGFQSYVGYPALCAGQAVGVLCAFYKDDVVPTEDDQRILGIIASALAAEEDRKRAGEELRRMQKLEELGTVAGGIAHDFNNLLTGIFGNLDLARMYVADDSAAGEYLRNAYQSIENARALTGQLLTFARGGAPALGKVNTAEIVRDTVDFNLHGSSVWADFDLPEDVWPLEADKGQIGQVLANLTVNAKQAMPGGGTLHVQACNIPQREKKDGLHEPRDFVRITIRDQGSGIPQHLLERIFDPYFTTKEEGHGLGLSVVQSIIEQHRGGISVSSSPAAGTTFDVLLPALTHPIPEEPENTAKPDAVSGNASNLHILLMDDEEMIRKLGVTMLRYIGQTAETAEDGDEAVRKYSEAMTSGRPFDVVIMDLTIRGGMGGEEAVIKLLEIDPEARVIVASGYASDPVMANYNEYGFAGKLAKPYELLELKQEISRVSGAK